MVITASLEQISTANQNIAHSFNLRLVHIGLLLPCLYKGVQTGFTAMQRKPEQNDIECISFLINGICKVNLTPK